MLNGKINVTTHSLYAGHHCAHSAIVYERDLIPVDNKKTYVSISPLGAFNLGADKVSYNYYFLDDKKVGRITRKIGECMDHAVCLNSRTM